MDKIKILDSRINLLLFFANFFAHEPNSAFLDHLLQPDIENFLTDLGVKFKDKLWEKPADKILLELEIEFSKLFLGPGKHIPPYESIQRGEGRFWGDHTVAVNNFYQDNGFKIREDFKDMPDHLSVELEFLAYLLMEEKKALKLENSKEVSNLQQKQKEFLEKHLLIWITQFAEKIKAKAKYAFYKEFINLVVQFLNNELLILRQK